MVHGVVCRNCNLLVEYNPRKLSGCACDPDAPTWVAIEPDGRILKMSSASFTVLEDE